MCAMVIIPAYNEEEHVVGVVNSVSSHVGMENVVVVDDGSTDKTFDLVKDLGCVILRQPVNTGKGGALRTGCDYAFKHGAGVVVLVDSDGQHDPCHIPEILKYFNVCENNDYDVVFSYRERGKNMPFVLRIGNGVLGFLNTLLCGVSVRDPQCGFRAFTKEAYGLIRWETSGYSVENEMIFNVGRNKLVTTEIPIKTIYNDGYKGTNVVDGLSIFLNMLWWRLTRK